MKTVRLLEDELQELLDEAQALQNLADRDQGGIFDNAQQARWDDLMATSDEDPGQRGLIQKKQEEVEAARKIEEERRQLASHRQRMAGNSPFAAGADKGQKLTKVNIVNRGPRLKCFKGDNALRDAYDSGMWLRAMFARFVHAHDEEAEQRVAARGWNIQAQHVGSSDPLGGYLVPDPLSTAIINHRELSGVTRSLVDVRAMTADTLDVPWKTDTTTVYIVDEAAAITTSEQTFAQVNLVSKKRAILSQVSQELQDDAVINVVDDLAREMGSDFAIDEDNTLINADGTAGFGSATGLINSIGAAGLHTASANNWDALTIADFTAAMAKLPTKYRASGPVWLMSPQFYDGVVTRIMAEAGVNTIGQFEMGGSGAGGGLGAQGRFMGYPVWFTDHMPAEAASTVFAFFGDFSRSVMMGDRIGVRIAFSGDYAFNQDLITVRGTSRWDLKTYNPGDGSDVGGYVALQTAV